MTATVFGAGSLVGTPVRRVEDPALLRGEGTFIDNLELDNPVHLAFVRSPDRVSVELLQKGAALPPAEPWATMPNVGQW